MNKKDKKINLIVLGGLEEIGKNCLLIENNKKVIMIDCGLKFSNDNSFGAQFEIPNFNYLKDKTLAGIVVTHGHLDHIGAFQFFLKNRSTKIYASNFTLELIKKQLTKNIIDNNEFIEIFDKKNFDLADISFTPFNVNHSIIESLGFIIDLKISGKSKIIHTGDFNIDPNPFQRKSTDLSILEKHKNEILLLLSDSTNSLQKTNVVDESTVLKELDKIFQNNKNKNKIVITTFSTQIPRLLKIFELSKKYNRKIFISGRSIKENIDILINREKYKNFKNQLIHYKDINKNKKIIIIASGTQGEKNASINKISEGIHSQLKLTKDDLILFSSSVIPGNEKDVFLVWNRLSKNNISYLTSHTHDIHTSGHSAEDELQVLLKSCKPEYFIPIHGENRHLNFHRDIAIKNGIKKDKVFVLENNQKIEISKGTVKVKESYKIKPTIISNQNKEIEEEIVNERKEIGLNGILVVNIFENKNIKVISQSFGVFLYSNKKAEMDDLNKRLKEFFINKNVSLNKKSYRKIQMFLADYFNKKSLNIPTIIINFNND